MAPEADVGEALSSRVALVTGGGRGIGRAIALAFAREGAAVAVTARTDSELNAVTRDIRELGRHSLAIPADLTRPDAARLIVDQARQALGPIQILVNAAGIGSSAGPSPVVDFSDELWELTLRTNVTAPYHLCKAVLPDMIRLGWGRIITIASVARKAPNIHGVAYTTSKHAVIGLTRAVAAEVAHHGVTVNAICPGRTRTRMGDSRVRYDAGRLGCSFDEVAGSLTAIGRRLEPDEIAPLAVWLASDAASVMTGQAVDIDGGPVDPR